ncbi:MAG: Rib/alpha-like domain-containing protein [Planctomycetota bacterium]|nr:Rib/alpha-like domain-containing protein [Planctomycetota bacterium]
MKRSEKLLAAVLLTCVGLFVVVPWIWGAFRGPVAVQEDKLERASARLQKTIKEFDVARASIQSMRVFKEQSLSSNSAEGALAYQQWLTDLAEIVAGFSGAEVTPERISPSRDNSYVAVRLRVTGDGTMEQLRTFLYHFHRANVLHRISSMVVDAQNNSSRPKLTIRITTEAISLRDAPTKGPTLFPRTNVTSINKDDGSVSLEVESVEGFPEAAPFELRIGSHYYNVADVDGNTLLLKLDEGQKLAAAVDDIVELSITQPDFADISIDEYDALIRKNPFAKPVPYRPQFDLIGSKKVRRGATMSLTAKISGVDTAAGDVDYKVLSDLPVGMTFDAGRLQWEPPAELAAGNFTVKVRASGGGLQKPLDSDFTLTLFEENKPPVITIPDNLVATLGQTMTTKLAATDPETPAEELKFALAAGAPEGTTLDAATGELTFTPAAAGEPGDISINVTVTDGGTPAQTTTAAVKFSVQDDKAQFTFMTGIVAADADRQAWLRDQSTNKRIVLREGDDLKYAGINAVVLSIGDDFLLMQQASETLRLNVGQNLRQVTVIARLDPPVRSTDSTDETSPACATSKEDVDKSDASSSGVSEQGSNDKAGETSQTAPSTAAPAVTATDSTPVDETAKTDASPADTDTTKELDVKTADTPTAGDSESEAGDDTTDSNDSK